MYTIGQVRECKPLQGNVMADVRKQTTGERNKDADSYVH
jgi:hypothetical protein